jgi:hypothetical protein
MQIIKVSTSSIEKRAISDLDYTVTYSETFGGGASINQNIIELTAGEPILTHELIYINSTDGKAYKADYGLNRACSGVCVDGGAIDETIRVQLSGLIEVFNNTATDYYLGAGGNVRAYGYESNKLLQYIAKKIDNNRILLDIRESILME